MRRMWPLVLSWIYIVSNLNIIIRRETLIKLVYLKLFFYIVLHQDMLRPRVLLYKSLQYEAANQRWGEMSIEGTMRIWKVKDR